MGSVQSWAEIGERIRQARSVERLTQQQVADSLGVDRTAVVKIEAGDRQVSALELFGLADLLRVPIGYFVAELPDRVVSRRAALSEDADQASRASWRLDVARDAHARDAQSLVVAELLADPSRPLVEPVLATTNAARELAQQARAAIDTPSGPLGELADVLERFSLYLLVVDEDADGASMLLGEVLGVAVIGGQAAPGRRRATAAHELGHHLLGDAYQSDVGVTDANDIREQAINAFAGEFLLPRADVISAWPPAVSRVSLRRAVIDLAGRYRVSWTLAIEAARAADLLDAPTARWLKAEIPVDGDFLAVLGRRPAEDLRVGTTGARWRQAVMEAYQRDLLTAERAVEMLHGLLAVRDLPARQETVGQ